VGNFKYCLPGKGIAWKKGDVKLEKKKRKRETGKPGIVGTGK